MKYGKLFFAFLLMFITAALFSQSLERDFPKLMFVTSREGLRVRAEPSINAKIKGTLVYGEHVQVLSRQSASVTIDGITDYWYNSSQHDGWIFGGYLSEELPPDLPVIIGRWNIINNKGLGIVFYQRNHDFAFGAKETSSGIGGTWRIDGNQITVDLELHPPPLEEGEIEYKTIYIQLKVIDKNNIELTFSTVVFGYKTVRLRRDRTGW